MNEDATKGSGFIYVGGEWRPKSEPLPVRPESAGWVYLDELSPELNELLANTPTLTDEDLEELAEANRRLGIPWWKRLFINPKRPC